MAKDDVYELVRRRRRVAGARHPWLLAAAVGGAAQRRHSHERSRRARRDRGVRAGLQGRADGAALARLLVRRRCGVPFPSLTGVSSLSTLESAEARGQCQATTTIVLTRDASTALALPGAPAQSYFVTAFPDRLAPSIGELLPRLLLSPLAARQYHQFERAQHSNPQLCVWCAIVVLGDGALKCRQCARWCDSPSTARRRRRLIATSAQGARVVRLDRRLRHVRRPRCHAGHAASAPRSQAVRRGRGRRLVCFASAVRGRSFRQFDIDKTGLLRRDELSHLFGMSEAEVDEFMRRYDTRRCVALVRSDSAHNRGRQHGHAGL